MPGKLLDPIDRAQRRLFTSYSQSAERRGLEITLSREELWNVIQLPCFYCGYPPTDEHRLSYNTTYTGNGVDRLMNSRGYVVGNVVSCCTWCNRAKGTLIVDEFMTRVIAAAQHIQEQKLILLFNPELAEV